jgi:serine/threonine protein kinase
VSHCRRYVNKYILYLALSSTNPYNNSFEPSSLREVVFSVLNSSFLKHPCISRCRDIAIEPISTITQIPPSEPGAMLLTPNPNRDVLALEFPPPQQIRLQMDNGGINLWNWMKATSVTHQDRFIRGILYQLLHVLATLEGFSMVHNDLKPWNVVINPETGKLVIIDWGSAVLDSHIVEFEAVRNALLCTLQYAPPEMHPNMRGGPRGPLHPLNDVFSLGMSMLSFVHRHFFDKDEVVNHINKHQLSSGECPEFDVWQSTLCTAHCPAHHKDKLTRRAPNLMEAVPLIQRMVTLNPHSRPLASELILHPYFDVVRHILKPVSEVQESIMHPIVDRGLVLDLAVLFQKHPALNRDKREGVIEGLRRAVARGNLNCRTALTLAVSILDRYLVLQKEPVSVELYRGTAYAALFVATAVRFNDVTWVDWYRKTHEPTNIYPPTHLSWLVSQMMIRMGYDMWSYTFDSLPDVHLWKDNVHYDAVVHVVVNYPLLERTQWQLCARYMGVRAKLLGTMVDAKGSGGAGSGDGGGGDRGVVGVG